MNTKIYKGFRIKTDSFQEAINIVNNFRPWIEKQAEDVIDEFFKNMEEAKKKSEVQEDSNDIKIKIFTIWNELRHKVKEKGIRSPAIDTDFSITLIPKNGYLLGIVYTERFAWYEQWCKQPKVESYSYYNNSDKPEEISKEDWNQRAEDWDILNYKPDCMQGFTIDLIDPIGPAPSFLRNK